MTIEEIRKALTDYMMPAERVERIIESIVAIRTAAYNEGFDDATKTIGGAYVD